MATMPFASLVHIPVGHVTMEGMLEVPAHACGVVLFAHGSGSSRHSPRNNAVARVLRAAGLGTLLMDLLTPAEDSVYEARFDIARLTLRLRTATRWLRDHDRTGDLPIGYFGASTGAAAALQAAADEGTQIGAVVSRGGRPDLAGADALRRVRAPTLLLVGGDDDGVLELNREAADLLECDKQLIVVPGASHLFEEPGTLDEVARQAVTWFTRHLGGSAPR